MLLPAREVGPVGDVGGPGITKALAHQRRPVDSDEGALPLAGEAPGVTGWPWERDHSPTSLDRGAPGRSPLDLRAGLVSAGVRFGVRPEQCQQASA